jgi:hypothetical protein
MPSSKWGSRVVLGCVVVLGSACSGSIKDDAVTEVNKTTLFGQIKHSRDLTIEEVALLQGFVIRKGLGDVLAGKTTELPVGMTIGDMIDAQRTWVDDEKKREANNQDRVAQARADEERQRKELLQALTVTVVEKGFQSADHQDSITFTVVYENKSGKDIGRFRGSILFSDLFDVDITPFTISEDEPLTAGATKRQRWTMKYDQSIDSHVKLRNSSLDSLKIEWRPQAILFVDGAAIEVRD